VRETAAESHPFRKVREKGWGAQLRRPTHRKERDEWGSRTLHKLVLKAEASAQREDAASKSTRNRAEV